MSKISNWIWTEIVILIGLFIAFLAGLLDAKTYASVAIGVFVVFAVPAFSVANSIAAIAESATG